MSTMAAHEYYALTVNVRVLVYGLLVIRSLTTLWLQLKEWVVELGATRTADVTCCGKPAKKVSTLTK